MGFHIDTSEVDRLVVDMTGADRRVVENSRPVMKRTALEVKRRMMKDFRGHRYAGGVPYSLEFQQTDAHGLGFEIGELDSAGRQWGIAAILAYGTSNNAPNVDHTAALRGEAPVMAEHLADVAEDSVLGGQE